MGNESPSVANSFAENFKISLSGTLVRVMMGPLRVFYRDSAVTKGTEESRKYVMQFVKTALRHRDLLESGKVEKSSTQSYVFLHELVKQTQDETVLTDQLLSILLAGRDTTAILLSVTFFILAKRNDIWYKLRDAVLELRGKKPSFEDLKSMKYLTWIMNESKGVLLSFEG